ncbi:MAG: hypothetical protein QHH13_02375 [Melioribacter sp.]|uniref:hypothetical protein n=1 Tax=Rosettibacter primus TaxID=3111523 RepID=UPI00247F15C1|nr:hypothetical protein [Melioribacter sp.]
MKPAKRNKFIYSFGLCFLLLLLTNCTEKKIDEEIAVRIYVENIILEEKYSYNVDSLKIYRRKLFEKYMISQNDFEEYLRGLKANQKSWENFFKKADKFLIDLKNTNAIN